MSALPALQRTLAAEHAAVYVLGALGAQTPKGQAPTLLAAVSAAYAEHRARRDHLVRTVRQLGGSPVAAAPAYEVPTTSATSASVGRGAAEVERRCGETYAYLVAHTEDAQRRWAVTALTDSALRRLTFGAEPEPFPGLPARP